MFGKKVKCFNCEAKIKKPEKAFTIKLNTLEGLHEVKMCPECAQRFDKIALQLEEILNERDESI